MFNTSGCVSFLSASWKHQYNHFVNEEVMTQFTNLVLSHINILHCLIAEQAK